MALQGGREFAGAHPSQTGYGKMATNWFPAVTEAIVRQQAYPAPHIASISVSNNAVVLNIRNLTAGETVDIEQSPSLLTTHWIPVEHITPTDDSATWTQIIEETNNTSFFRLVQP